MKLKFKVYECDDCHKRAGEFADDKEARAAGWVISHDRKNFTARAVRLIISTPGAVGLNLIKPVSH